MTLANVVSSHQRQVSAPVLGTNYTTATGGALDTVTKQETVPGVVTGDSVTGDHGQTAASNMSHTRSQELGGSNEDMKKVLMALDNTGYFAEVLFSSFAFFLLCCSEVTWIYVDMLSA